jgi:hypothetical protein
MDGWMTRPTDPNGRRMASWLPPIWYDQAQSVNALLESEGEGITQFQADTQLVNDARLPEAAPDWGIERFEEELGLSVSPPGMNLTDRRSRIIARFRGIGSTIYRLKAISATWQYGNIAILPGIEDWTLYIQFIDTYGIPDNIESHQAEIRNNVEAHLNIVWAYHFTLWQEVKNTGVLWCQLKTAGTTWDQLKLTPFANLPTAVECSGEPPGSFLLEVVDQTGLGNLAYQYPQSIPSGNVTTGTTDPFSFPLD